jgi:hypothetical protein
MLALVGYPFLLEPWAPTRAQALGWSGGYALFVGLCIAAGWHSLRTARVPSNAYIAADGVATTIASADEPPPTVARQILWCTLAATGSLLLLAVSNHITQDIASIPLLWIAPLAIYLLTFILCFAGSGWYRREIFLSTAAASLGVMAWTRPIHRSLTSSCCKSAYFARGCSSPACSVTASSRVSNPRQST